MRSRSRRELEGRLLAAGYAAEEVGEVLASLESAGLVEDERFAREVVRYQAGRRLAGDRAIRGALRQKGVAPDVVESALLEAGSEAERASQLALSRVRQVARLSPQAASRRLYGFLLRRGYGGAVARDAVGEALREAFEDPPELPQG